MGLRLSEYLLNNDRAGRICTALACLMLGPACTGISIAPSCPNELEVAQSGVILANELEPGAIPVYAWIVDPPDAGTVENPAEPSTTFTAQKPGVANLILVASDGLYQVRSSCVINIQSAGVVVALASAPARPTVNAVLTLTCSSAGDVEAERFVIEQVEGPTLTLTTTTPGVATTTPGIAGDYSFRCTGFGADDQPSDPALLDVTVTTGGRPGGPR